MVLYLDKPGLETTLPLPPASSSSKSSPATPTTECTGLRALEIVLPATEFRAVIFVPTLILLEAPDLESVNDCLPPPALEVALKGDESRISSDRYCNCLELFFRENCCKSDSARHKSVKPRHTPSTFLRTIRGEGD